MSKRYRQEQIRRVIRAKAVHTQEELAAELSKIGIPATQVTLSRDLRELNLVKTNLGYRELDAPNRESTPESDITELVNDYVVDVRCAQNMLLLKTDPGHASPVAVALDHSNWPEIVGTVAGDDTILIITPDKAVAEQLRRRFAAMLA
jgi:transcriptional regulator of arginine metabolism